MSTYKCEYCDFEYCTGDNDEHNCEEHNSHAGKAVFIASVFELAFGDDAINEEVLDKLREFSDTALQLEGDSQ